MNAFFCRRAIVRAMLDSPKSGFVTSAVERAIFGAAGAPAIALFGWPLWLKLRLVYHFVGRLLPPGPGQLLDAGGSWGAHAFALARHGWQVTVVDIDTDNLMLGQNISRILGARDVSFQRRDVLNTGFPDGSFDVVLATELIEHLKDDKRGVLEMRRMLRPNGLLVASVPHSNVVEEFDIPRCAALHLQRDVPEHLWIGGYHWRSGYSEEALAALLEQNGFSVEALRSFRLPRLLPQSPALFPITFPLALLAQPLSRTPIGLAVRARKR